MSITIYATMDVNDFLNTVDTYLLDSVAESTKVNEICNRINITEYSNNYFINVYPFKYLNKYKFITCSEMRDKLYKLLEKINTPKTQKERIALSNFFITRDKTERDKLVFRIILVSRMALDDLKKLLNFTYATTYIEKINEPIAKGKIKTMIKKLPAKSTIYENYYIPWQSIKRIVI
jgi:hypothetical protein